LWEKKIGTPHSVLYFNASEKLCIERALERAKTSGQFDDTEEIITKRFQTFT